jgi:hemolysin activation/secretion protein
MAQTHTFFTASFLAHSLALAFSAVAQTPPVFDAGALMRQNEQSIRAQQQQQTQANRIASLPPVAVLSESTLVKPERFNFIGNQRLSTEQLQALTVPFANRPLNQHDLLHLTDAVSQAYRKAGWWVQAYIPRQNLAGPELSIQVIESIPPNKPKN